MLCCIRRARARTARCPASLCAGLPVNEGEAKLDASASPFEWALRTVGEPALGAGVIGALGLVAYYTGVWPN